MNLFPIVRVFMAIASKVGKIPFLKFDYNGNEAPNGAPTLIEADFTRANSSEDGNESGAIKWNGSKFIKLGANEPRVTKLLNHQVSCDVLELLPAKKSFNVNSKNPLSLTQTNIVLVPNQSLDPFGGQEMAAFTTGGDVSSTRHRALIVNVDLTQGQKYHMTVFATKQDEDWLQIVPASGTGFSNLVWANFNINEGYVGNVGSDVTDAYIIDLKNGIYLCVMEALADATSTSSVDIVSTNNSNSSRYPSYQQVANTTNFYFYGLQVGEGNFDQYVETSGTAITRNADVISDITDLVGDGYLDSTSEGTLILQLDTLPGATSAQRIGLQSAAAVNMIAFNYLNGSFAIYDYFNGLYVFTNTNPEGFNKWIISWKDNNLSIYYNGVRVYTGALGSNYSINRLRFMSTIADNRIYLKHLDFKPTEMTLAEGQLTSSWDNQTEMFEELNYVMQ